MERFYRFAGITFRITGNGEDMYREDGVLRPFRVEGPDFDHSVSCRAGYSTFWITWDGRMLPCGMMPGPEARPLTDGFDAAWEHIRTETRKNRLPKACAACAKREVCAACAAVCVTETGRFDGVPEYMCRMTDGILEQMGRVTGERSKE